MYHLPSYYDTLNTPGTSEDVTLYTRIAKRYGRSADRWLEPACGTGRHLRVIARRGLSAWGFDLDAGMLAYARNSLAARKLSATVYSASMASFLQPINHRIFDVAINPHSSFRHLLDEKAAIGHLNQMAKCLSRGGVYILGISLANYDRDRDETDLWLAARGRMHIRQQITYKAPLRKNRIEKVESLLTVTRPSRVEKHRDGYLLRTYSARQWDRLVGASNMNRVITLDEEGKPARKTGLSYQLEILTPK